MKSKQRSVSLSLLSGFDSKRFPREEGIWLFYKLLSNDISVVLCDVSD
jgi:hypothetical protein